MPTTQDVGLERFRLALPEHERGAGWEQAVLLAIDTRRELLAAVDEHVPGWDPARNAVEVVGCLAEERSNLQTRVAELTRERDLLATSNDVRVEIISEFRSERDALRTQMADLHKELLEHSRHQVELVKGHDELDMARLREVETQRARASELEEECDALRTALERIVAWDFSQMRVPSLTEPGQTDSYGWAYGSNGERDYMRKVAQCALDATTSPTPIAVFDPYTAQVRRFHEAMGLPVRTTPDVGTSEERVLGVRLLLEEVLEFAAACAVRVLVHVGRGGVLRSASDLEFEPHDVNQPDLVAMTHELGDVQVIVSGRAAQFGLPVLEAVTEEIHPANMRKLGPDGKPVRRSDGKVVKPEGWQPANVARVVERAMKADGRAALDAMIAQTQADGGYPELADAAPPGCDCWRKNIACIHNPWFRAKVEARVRNERLASPPPVSRPLVLSEDVLWTNGRIRVHASGTVQVAPHWDAIQDADLQAVGAALVGMVPASHVHLVVADVARVARRLGAEEMREAVVEAIDDADGLDRYYLRIREVVSKISLPPLPLSGGEVGRG